MAASTDRLLVVRPGAGKRSGDVEFLATSDDTPRLNVCTILIDPWSKGVPPHEHVGEDDAFYALEGEVTFDGDDPDAFDDGGGYSALRTETLSSSATNAEALAAMERSG